MSRALLLMLVAFVAACVLRFPSRELKTMHTDEATQAVKLHEMMEGQYQYDPKDHHGPTLLYSTNCGGSALLQVESGGRTLFDRSCEFRPGAVTPVVQAR